MRNLRFVLYGCFFISGLSALVYEIVWQRMLTLVFGVSTWSITAVLTAYMGGLALGAWAFARAADRRANPIRFYGALELTIAAAGLTVSYAIDPLMTAYVSIAHAFEPGFATSNLIRFGLAMAVFIVPCTLIGATVPVMGRLVTRGIGSVGIGFGRFYAVNTLGAVLGAALTGFFLIRLVGMHAAVWVAVGGNVLVAIVALALSGAAREPAVVSETEDRSGPRPREPSACGEAGRHSASARLAEPSRVAGEDGRGGARAALIIAAIVGFTGLGYEVAWARLLAIYTLNSVYVFTMILTVFLAGLALGSAAAAWLIRRWKPDLLRAVGVAQMVLAMTCPVVLGFARAAGEVGREFQYRSPTRIFVLEYALVAATVLVPALLLGMTLPLLVGLVRGGSRAPGETAGRVYAANSVGTIIGAAVTGIVLIPALGLRTTLMGFAAINFCVGCYAATVAPDTARRLRQALIPAAAVCLVLLSLLTPFGTRFIRPAGAGDEAVLYYAEGDSAVVHIAQTEAQGRDFRVLYVDSQSVAGTSDEIVTDQKMLAHLPLLLHPDPKRALTVGFGTGGTSYSMLLHGVVTHCVEIERAVAGSARFFTDQNGGVVGLAQGLDSGRRDFRLIIDDARSWLHLAREPYDVIVNDLTSIQYNGNGNLFTVECFDLIRRNLAPDGIGCAWAPLTGVDPAPLRVLIRSFHRVFPHTSIWYMSNRINDFVILVGTPRRLEIDLDAWKRRMADPYVAADLAAIELDSPYKLACSLLVSEDGLDCLLGDGPVHTDDRPVLDYLTHAGVYRDTLAANLRAMLACPADARRFAALDPEGSSSEESEAEWDRWQEAIGHVLTGHAFQRERDAESARAAYAEAGRLVPDDPGIARLAGSPNGAR